MNESNRKYDDKTDCSSTLHSVYKTDLKKDSNSPFTSYFDEWDLSGKWMLYRVLHRIIGLWSSYFPIIHSDYYHNHILSLVLSYKSDEMSSLMHKEDPFKLKIYGY